MFGGFVFLIIIIIIENLVNREMHIYEVEIEYESDRWPPRSLEYYTSHVSQLVDGKQDFRWKKNERGRRVMERDKWERKAQEKEGI